MVEGVKLGPLTMFALVLCLTPGPNVVMVTASAANFGFNRAIPQMLGITLGFGLMAMASGLGLAGLIHAEPRLHGILKYLGAAYLLYLAWRIAHADPGGDASARAQPISLVEAALFTWANPKAWVTALGAVATHTATAANVLVQSLIVAVVLAVACLVSVAIWAGFGAAIGRCLSSPRMRVAFNRSMAGLLVVSLMPVFL